MRAVIRVYKIIIITIDFSVALKKRGCPVCNSPQTLQMPVLTSIRVHLLTTSTMIDMQRRRRRKGKKEWEEEISGLFLVSLNSFSQLETSH